ncbi:hypothetical protein BUALT_Bualt15G0111500 [Buddleja alternifolia]|uniref:X8 domain-containing protein n=1 Tax=Buddleja alternifolia TaxID=168488 RepID=A0AAV6WJJ7_9LAMI|nr:hypothetical protein BUALT_Bualt15G0111500 [Buddleja alternifolia]
MAKNALSLLLMLSLLGVVAYANNEQSQKQADNYCIARLNAGKDALLQFLNFACAQIDCNPIQPGGLCFEPTTIISHGSYALDAFFRKTGSCNSLGRLQSSDPSYAKCRYP